MRIKRFISQFRRDFRGDMECEHCGFVEEKSGYDDSYFHNEVIPQMKCSKCGKTAPDDYRPYTPKHDDSVTI